MKHVLAPLSALAIGLVLTGCSPKSETVDAPYAGVETENAPSAIDDYIAFADTPFTLEGGSDSDLAPLIAALPDGVTLSWDTRSFDADTGATVFTGLDLQVAEPAPFGLKAGRVAFWGLDSDFIADRISGQRLDEAGLVFARMDAEQLEYHGLAEADRTLILGLVDTITDEAPLDPDMFDIEQLDASVARWVVSDFGLRPWHYTPVEEDILDAIDDEEAAVFLLPALRLGQQALAFQGALEFGRGAMFDADSTFALTQPGARMSGTSSIDFYGMSGGKGWDLDELIAQGLKSEQVTTYTEMPPSEGEFGAPFGSNPLAGKTISQSTETAQTSVRGLRLDKAMQFLAEGELPGLEEKDLLSLGVWNVQDYQLSLDGDAIFAADSIEADLDQWVWLIPSRIDYQLDNGTLKLGRLANFFTSFVPDGGDGVDEETALVMEGINKAIDLLPEHDLDEIMLDLSGNMSWSDESGATRAAFSVGATGFGERYFDLRLGLPDYDALVEAKASEDFEDAFEDVFQAHFSFDGITLREVDSGGYDRLFGYARDVGGLYPEEGWGAMLANLEPQDMRNYVATMIRMGKAELANELPPAADWLETIAIYFEQGGELEIKSDPPVPITTELMDQLDDEAEGPEPFLGAFNISVVHTPN